MYESSDSEPTTEAHFLSTLLVYEQTLEGERFHRNLVSTSSECNLKSGMNVYTVHFECNAYILLYAVLMKVMLTFLSLKS